MKVLEMLQTSTLDDFDYLKVIVKDSYGDTVARIIVNDDCARLKFADDYALAANARVYAWNLCHSNAGIGIRIQAEL